MCNDDTVCKLKNDFHYTLSKFSHEIRNPLTLISSELQLLVSSHPEIADDTVWDDIMDNVEYMKERSKNRRHRRSIHLCSPFQRPSAAPGILFRLNKYTTEPFPLPSIL